MISADPTARDLRDFNRGVQRSIDAYWADGRKPTRYYTRSRCHSCPKPTYSVRGICKACAAKDRL